MKIINRQIEKELRIMAAAYPVITITGPRQSGKTTLAKYVFPDKPYFSFENPDTCDLAKNDPKGFLNHLPEGAILDEIQNASHLISYIQTIVDEKEINGMFILTGSNQFLLLNKVNQSLAGRTAILKLLPLSFQEIESHKKGYEIDDLLYNGFYPAIYSKNREATKSYSFYYQTYLEKDVRELINLKNLSLFKTFIKLCAGRVGQIFNASKLANETGVSVPTIKSWISILEASYVIYLLPPWYDNISKRLIKSPKLYFYDVGLASYLLGVRNKRHLIAHPLRGNLFENMIVSELLKTNFNRGADIDLYYFRDSNGNEIDLLIPDGQDLIPIEIKSSETFHNQFLKGIHYIDRIYSSRIKKSYILYGGNVEQKINKTSLLNYWKTSKCTPI
jgi:predicted AAA+ superfamily ATPase